MGDLAFSTFWLASFLFVPGFVAFRAVVPRGRTVEAVALAPVLGLALSYLVGVVGLLTGLPVGPALWFCAVGVAAATAVARVVRASSGNTSSHRPTPAGLGAVLMLGGAIVIGTMTWTGALRNHTVTPPDFDATHHGFMVARIAEAETIDFQDVWWTDPRPDPDAPPEDYTFYPLALHVTAAIVHTTTGFQIADLLTAAMVLAASVVLPLGVFSWSRRLWPERPLIAGTAALLSPAIALFPYGPTYIGAIPMMLGIACVPACVPILVDGFTLWKDRGAFALAVLTLVGAFGTHTSEVPTLLLFTVSFLVAHIVASPHRRRVARRVIMQTATVGTVCLVLLAPVVPDLLSNAGGRQSYDDVATVPLRLALGDLLTLRVPPFTPNISFLQTALAFAMLVGVGVALRRRCSGALVVALSFNVILYLVAASSEESLAQRLTLPWYHRPDRIGYTIAVFAALFGALALMALVELLANVPHIGARGSWALSALSAVVVLAGVAHESRDEIEPYIAITLSVKTPIGSDEVLAFRYLESHVGPGETVVSDAKISGSLWMYAFSDGDVVPTFLVPPADENVWNERAYMALHITELATDSRARATAERYGVCHIFLGRNEFYYDPNLRVLNLDLLLKSPEAPLVFQRGSAYVFSLPDNPWCEPSIRNEVRLFN